MRLYTVLDRVAEECGPVFTAGNDGVALRQFKRLTENTVDPSDYRLFLLGSFDPKSMALTVEVNPVEVVVHSSLGAVAHISSSDGSVE